MLQQTSFPKRWMTVSFAANRCTRKRGLRRRFRWSGHLAAAWIAAAACGDGNMLSDASLDDGDMPIDGSLVDTDGIDTSMNVDAQDAASRNGCELTADEVYASTTNGAAAGELIGCATGPSYSLAELEALVDSAGVVVQSAVDEFLIAYQTERKPSTLGTATARLLLPIEEAEGGPVIVVNHGTVGLADHCAPSRNPRPDTELALPWAASGYVTVAVDYAGLGTFGTQGYGDEFDTAQSALDGARAALRWLGEPRPIVFVGLSQGGGVSLSAQGLAAQYAPELEIQSAISFAGGSGTPLVLTPATAPFLGNVPIAGGLGVFRAAIAMVAYADLINATDEATAAAAFHPSVRDNVVASIQSDCIVQMSIRLATATSSYTPPATLGQLLSPEFLAAVQACITGSAGCTEAGQAYVDQRTMRGFVPVDATGGAVVLFGGADDPIYPPQSFACAIADFDAAGANIQSCFLSGSNHFTITGNSIASAIDYVRTDSLNCPASATTPPPCAR